MDKSPSSIYILDMDRNIRYCNEAWYTMMGISRDAEGAEPWSSAIHPEDLEITDIQWRGLCANQGPSTFEFCL